MIPYSKNYFTLGSLFQALVIRDAQEKIKKFFREYTGKKYILITNSCRSALYLTYKGLDLKGNIITSPLTCKVAIDPIIAAGYQPVFQDIDKDTLVIQDEHIENCINDTTRGIQLIHLGGIPCNSEKFQKIARSNKLFLIEDCAQGLFAEMDGIKAGTFGDFICFSLIKNAKGIGGGILATNNEEVYRKASQIQGEFKNTPSRLVAFRVLRNLLENYRKFFIVNGIYNLLLRLRGLDKKNAMDSNIPEFFLKLLQPSKLETNISAIQLRKAVRLKEKRLRKGKIFIEMLQKEGFAENYIKLANYKPSFVKLIVYSKILNSRKHIQLLNQKGIEAMHLEHKHKIYYQYRFDISYPEQEETLVDKCKKYIDVHDNIISLPFHEGLSTQNMKSIIQSLKSLTD
jgi:dTDP-4-amino-4,6-dideoxygalactose transaminase